MTVIERVSAKIEALESKKAGDIKTAEEEIAKIREAISAEETKLKEATAELDADKYDAAKRAKEKQEIRLQMYLDRLAQIREREMISEEESDKVIDSLLNYERELEANYEKEIAALLCALKQLTDKQYREAAEAERIIKRWTLGIKPNYRSFTGTLYPDGTNRSPKPIAIHPRGYFGGETVALVNNLLSNPKIRKITGESQDQRLYSAIE